MKVHVLLPAFNEAQALPRLLARLAAFQKERAQPIEVWIVDDGSEDKTLEVARRVVPCLETHVIAHVGNQGLGQAVLTGLTGVLGRAEGDDVLVVMDADDTHDPAVISSFLDCIHRGADVVIASRFVATGDDSTAPSFRRLLSRFASVVLRLLLPIPGVRDFSSGYRAYRIETLRQARAQWGDRLIVERSFACMAELLVKLHHFSTRIEEVPLALRYDRKAGPSKMRLLPTVLQYLRLAVRDRMGPPPHRVEVRVVARTSVDATGAVS